MPSIEETINDPGFLKLSGDDQVAILKHLEGLGSRGETSFRQGLDSDRGISPLPSEQPEAHVDNLGAMPFVNRAISSTVGAPADLIAKGINALPGMDETNEIRDPFLGRQSIERGMESIGIRLPPEGQEPVTVPEHIGNVVGEASTYMLPVTKTMHGLSKGAGLVMSAGRNQFGRQIFKAADPNNATITGRVALTIYNSMIKHPYLTMTSEFTGSFGAGTGRGVAQQEFPDSPAAQTSIELAGGLAGAMIPTALANKTTMLAIRAGKNIYHRLINPFKKPGSMYRSGKFVKGKVADPTSVAAEAGAETIGDLPPAVASGQEKIIQLYKGLSALDPVSDAKSIEKISNSISKLDKAMRKMGYGSPELLAELTKKRIAAIELGMDKRVIDATAKAQERLGKIPVSQRKAAESRIVGEELRGVMFKERAANKEIWLDVDKSFGVDTDTTRATYKALIDDLGQSQKVDVPATLKGSTVIRGKKVKGKKTRNFTTTVKEMQALRSKLGEKSRAARKEGEWNKARIADDVADAILEDIEIAATSQNTPDAENLKAALAATRQFKMRFESGEVGRVLGYSKSGAPSINPDLTLEQTVGRLGERGAIDINKIVVTPEAMAATERYLGRSFTDYAAPQGTVNPVKADRWIKTNEAILDEYPDLRKKLSDSAGAQSFADDTKVRMDARKAKLRDPKISVSANFLNKASLGKEISGIFQERHPSKFASELVKQANKDTTGDALDGLRAGFVEHILDYASKGKFNSRGEQTLSGGAMLNFIKTNEPTLRTVFDNNHIKRMKRVASEFSKLEMLKDARGTSKIDMTDWASQVLEMAARFGGAEFGGRAGGSMGGGMQHAGVWSGKARKLMDKLSFDKAKQIVQDAILSDDPKMLQALLEPMSKPRVKKEDIILLNKQLNAWLLSSGERVMDEQ